MGLLKSVAAGLLALPYRLRLGHLGRRPRLFPRVLLTGGRRIRLGDDSRVASYAALIAQPGGRIEIGNGCEIASFARLDADVGTIVIGDRSSVNPFSLLNGFGDLRIGSDVRIASHCVILSSTHGHEDPATSIREQGIEKQATSIGDDVWLGAHVVVMGGITIGAHCVVGAGSVVTSDIPPFAVAVGAPARVIRMRNA